MAEAPGHFRLKGGTRSGFTWQLTTDMGQIIASSGEFPDRETAEKAIQWVRDNAPSCAVLDPPSTGPAIG